MSQLPAPNVMSSNANTVPFNQSSFAHSQKMAPFLQPATGPEDPEEGFEGLIHKMDAPSWSNENIFNDVATRAYGLSPERVQNWWDMLFEQCFTQTQSGHNRLELAEKLLLTGKCDPITSSRACSLGSAVHIACESGTMQALQYALHIDPQGIFSLNATYGLTPFHCAAIRDDDEVYPMSELLIKAGLHINALSSSGESALFRALDTAPCKAFLELGMNPNLLSPHGASPLCTYLFLGAVECALLSLQHGAHPVAAKAFTKSSGKGGTLGPKQPLSFYCIGYAKGAAHPKLHALVQMGLDPKAIDSDGFCAFDHLPQEFTSQLEHQWISQNLAPAPESFDTSQSSGEQETKRL